MSYGYLIHLLDCIKYKMYCAYKKVEVKLILLLPNKLCDKKYKID